MPETRFNLLTEPLLNVRLQDRTERWCSLPDVLSLLAQGSVEAFLALQPHQTHAWHAFLVQLAAMAMHKAGLAAIPSKSDEWLSLLRGMTENRDEPWCLVVEDLALPAFFQSPVPEGNLCSMDENSFPDVIDILATAKNHDVKSARIAYSLPQHWIYALTSLQTMHGVYGRGKYGITRMNSGYGSRPSVSFCTDLDWNRRFTREVDILLRERNSIVAMGRKHRDGYCLLWLLPWDGTNSVSIEDCDPYFIEICRRIRLRLDSESFIAYTTSTSVSRLNAKELKGNVGDPWIPIDVAEGKALNVSGEGFSYRLLQDIILSGSYKQNMTQQILPDDTKEGWLITFVLSRGEGKTKGLHQRSIPIPGKIVRSLKRLEGRTSLAGIAKRRVDMAATLSDSVLTLPLKSLGLYGKALQNWLSLLDQKIDEIFFDQLWAEADLEPTESDRCWQRLIVDISKDILNEAIESTPMPGVRRYRLISKAQGLFAACCRKQFPDLDQSSHRSEEKDE